MNGSPPQYLDLLLRQFRTARYECDRRGCRGARITTAQQLCRAEIETLRAATGQGTPIAVGCVQEAPLFTKVSGGCGDYLCEHSRDCRLVRGCKGCGPEDGCADCGGHRADADWALVDLTSEGVALVYGRGDEAIEAATWLKNHLDVTVLINGAGEVARLAP